MYETTEAIINPDPSKYAYCEEGLQRLPRQCCRCKSLFTPVNDDQRYCEYCAPDPVVVPVVPNKIKQERKGIKRADPVKKTAYNLFLTNSRSRRNTQLKKGNSAGAAKWGLVCDKIKFCYKNELDINYDEIVKSVFEGGDNHGG